MMKILRKLIFFIILINLVKLNSCEYDLYQNFLSKYKKALDNIERTVNVQENEVEEKKEHESNGVEFRDAREEEFDYGDSEGSDENEEEARLTLPFRVLRTYRDENRFIGGSDGVAGYKNESNPILSSQQIQSTSTTISPPIQTTPRSSPSNNNANTTELANRVIETLNDMREELESMRMSKTCNETPDGSNCDMNGAWNAAEIGLHIELNSTSDDNKLLVTLAEKIPKKSSPYRIEASWNCSGYVAHKNGGPFYFHCTNRKLTNEMAIFHGICKRCSGFETIFGEWIFQHTPRDCRQLWTFSETKRDVFYRNILHQIKDQQKSDEGNKKANVNQAATSQNAQKTTTGISNSKTKRNHQNSRKYKTRKWDSQDFY